MVHVESGPTKGSDLPEDTQQVMAGLGFGRSTQSGGLSTALACGSPYVAHRKLAKDEHREAVTERLPFQCLAPLSPPLQAIPLTLSSQT